MDEVSLVSPKNASRMIKLYKTLDSIQPDLQLAENLSISTYSNVNASKSTYSTINISNHRVHRPSIKTLVRFACLSYLKPEAILKRLSEPEWVRRGWICLTTGRNEEDGYFGAAFWQEQEEQLVIVHRGTNGLQDAVPDVEGVLLKQYTSQIHSASTFASSVVTKFENTDCEITIIGHSLGGWLAPLSAFGIKYFRLKGKDFGKIGEGEKKYNPYVVTFDPPGCREVLYKLSKVYFDDVQSSMNVTSLSITNYFIKPNLVNTLNPHIGTICSFKKNNGLLGLDYHFSILDRLLFFALTHSMVSFLHTFENYSYPKFTYKASDWPKFNLLLALLPSPWIFIPWKIADDILLGVDLVFGMLRRKISFKCEPPFVIIRGDMSDIDFFN